MIRDCVVVAIEGTQASGKTTLAHGLVSQLAEGGWHVGLVDEPARTSPFVEDVVVHRIGAFDLVTELDLLSSQLSAQLRASRVREVLVCDKTVVNVVAYAAELLSTIPGSTLQPLRQFAQACARVYDLVFYCVDRYDDRRDPMRAGVQGRQASIDQALRAELTEAGMEMVDVPPALTTPQRVAFCQDHLRSRLGLRVPR